MSDALRFFLYAWVSLGVAVMIIAYAWRDRFSEDDPRERRRGVVTPPVSDSVETELQDMVRRARQAGGQR